MTEDGSALQEPVQPPALARAVALTLVTKGGMRLTHPSDSRLGPLGPEYALGTAIWTGTHAAFVGFYEPPADAQEAGADLARRCEVARQWGHERLTSQGAKDCDILLVALGPVAGSLTPPPGREPVQIGAISADPATGTVTELLPVPGGMPGARQIRSTMGQLANGAVAPTLAAVDVAERQVVGTGVRGRARSALVQTTPIMTYSLIGLWVGIWLLEHALVHVVSCPPGTGSQYECFQTNLSPDDFGTFFFGNAGPTDWWRWIASGFVHDFDDPLHVALNSFFMFQIGRLIEPMYGRMVMLGTFLFAVIGGSAFIVLTYNLGIYGAGGSLGASGGECGLLGLLLVAGRIQGKGMPPAMADSIRRMALTNTLFILIYSFALASALGIAWPAHVGGFIAGAAIGCVLAPRHAVGGRDMSVGDWAIVIALIAVSAVALLFAAAHVISVIQGSSS